MPDKLYWVLSLLKAAGERAIQRSRCKPVTAVAKLADDAREQDGLNLRSRIAAVRSFR
ncbi:hypothetical protein AAEP80_07060 [Curtobacterium sp. L3-7]|uniref:hypothetical protein n=1 Tax=Curtobacterium sp. L3-7 TaxID=3138787 RepID=UPI003B51A4CA